MKQRAINDVITKTTPDVVTEPEALPPPSHA